MTTIEDLVVRCVQLEKERDMWERSHHDLHAVIVRLRQEIERLYRLQDQELARLRAVVERETGSLTP